MANRAARKLRASRVGTVPVMRPTSETVRTMKDMQKWPDRMDRAMLLFMLDVSNYLRKILVDLAPDVQVEGKEKNYAEDLRIAILEQGEGHASIALYFEGSQSVLTEEKLDQTVLYFRSTPMSPDWVQVLTRYGPWPADMVPVQVKRGEAKVISRRARPDEMVFLADRILMNEREIVHLLRQMGASNVSIEPSGKAAGTVVHDDIGYNVLRREFGWDGQKQVAHWRPAFKKTNDYIKKSMRKMVKYVMTGREDVFNLPVEVGRVDMATFKQGEGFMKEIAPFAPWK